jgi:hypothetical protein
LQPAWGGLNVVHNAQVAPPCVAVVTSCVNEPHPSSATLYEIVAPRAQRDDLRHCVWVTTRPQPGYGEGAGPGLRDCALSRSRRPVSS